MALMNNKEKAMHKDQTRKMQDEVEDSDVNSIESSALNQENGIKGLRNSFLLENVMNNRRMELRSYQTHQDIVILIDKQRRAKKTFAIISKLN